MYDGTESMSYLQKLQKLTSSQSFNIQQYIDLLQAGQVIREVRERSEEEIGDGHQFHEKEKLQLSGFEENVIKAVLEVKDVLYGILDELEEQTNVRMATLISGEVEAGLFASDYIFLKEEENRFLAADIERLQGLINKLEIKQQNYAQKEIAATESLNENDRKCAANKADLEAYIEFYNTKKAQFLDEIATFKEILQMYESQILTSDEIDRIEE